MLEPLTFIPFEEQLQPGKTGKLLFNLLYDCFGAIWSLELTFIISTESSQVWGTLLSCIMGDVGSRFTHNLNLLWPPSQGLCACGALILTEKQWAARLVVPVWSADLCQLGPTPQPIKFTNGGKLYIYSHMRAHISSQMCISTLQASTLTMSEDYGNPLPSTLPSTPGVRTWGKNSRRAETKWQIQQFLHRTGLFLVE